MRILHKYSDFIFLFILGICVFYITINFSFPTDTYYDIKAGAFFLQHGLVFHDVFSYTAIGRAWYPYEWLFQIGIYELWHSVGIHMIAIAVSSVSVIEIFVLYFFLKLVFKIPSIYLFIISLIYTIVIFIMAAYKNLCIIVPIYQTPLRILRKYH